MQRCVTPFAKMEQGDFNKYGVRSKRLKIPLNPLWEKGKY